MSGTAVVGVTFSVVVTAVLVVAVVVAGLPVGAAAGGVGCVCAG